MRTKATEHGVLIPKLLLEGIDAVEIRKERNVIIIMPVMAGDPTLDLGRQPITVDMDDASP